MTGHFSDESSQAINCAALR